MTSTPQIKRVREACHLHYERNNKTQGGTTQRVVENGPKEKKQSFCVICGSEGGLNVCVCTVT